MVHLIHFVALVAALSFSLIPAVTATFWGNWGKVEYCPEGKWAVGFKLKTERWQGGGINGGDDTALNAIALKCSDGSWITSTIGPWGNWGGNFNCHGGRLTSCQLRVEAHQGTAKHEDDTAANNLNCKCSSGETLNGDGTDWGDWKGWSNTCNNGICAIQTRVEEGQGNGDDTALNDVNFICCPSCTNCGTHSLSG